MSKHFTEEHEWIEMESDDVATVGITEFAQEQLGEVVFVELPEVGARVNQGDELGVIESVKAAGEIKAPIGGVVSEINDTLNDDPGLINTDAEGDGWILKIEPSDSSELEKLLSADDYAALTVA